MPLQWVKAGCGSEQSRVSESRGVVVPRGVVVGKGCFNRKTTRTLVELARNLF